MKVPWPLLKKSAPLFFCALTFFLLNAAIIAMASYMYPVKPGKAGEYWYAMYFVQLPGSDSASGVYPTQGSSCIYYQSGFHGQFLRALPTEEVRRLLPQVRKAVAEGAGRISKEEKDLLLSGADIETLVATRLRLGAVEAEARGAGPYHHDVEQMFKDRWARIGRYWANVLFEVLFLNALLFGLWLPFFKQGNHLWRAIAVGAALPALFVPYFLGYCTWTFTSTGPIGGAFYPWTLIWLRRWGWDWNRMDEAFVKAMPSPLEFLTQSQGPMMSVSGMGAISPTSLLVFGVLLGLATYGSSRGLAKLFPQAPRYAPAIENK